MLFRRLLALAREGQAVETNSPQLYAELQTHFCTISLRRSSVSVENSSSVIATFTDTRLYPPTPTLLLVQKVSIPCPGSGGSFVERLMRQG
jgi:hypothetical protein